MPGFKKFVRQNSCCQVAQTLRIDVALEVGSATESVTVTEAAPLLKTESGELSHNVRTEQLDKLPVLGIGGWSPARRHPQPVRRHQLLPGATGGLIQRAPQRPPQQHAGASHRRSGFDQRLDGIPIADPAERGRDPGVSMQTSNYAAEFGQAGGGVFNATMKSGTNQYHGSAYEYFVNEALNAGTPFTNDGSGHLLRPRQRSNDYGFTIGGPVQNSEGLRRPRQDILLLQFRAVPRDSNQQHHYHHGTHAAYRTGDFGKALTNRNVCPAATPNCDPLGRPIMENPSTTRCRRRWSTASGSATRSSGNVIPTAQLDPVSLKVVSLIPQPTNAGLTNNYLASFTNPRLTYIPSLKLDHSLSAKTKISGYWSRTSTNTPNNNTLPAPITSAVGSNIVAHTIRLNFDQTFTPTLPLHLGAG